MIRNLTRSLQFAVVATLLLHVTSCGKASGSKPEVKAGSRVEGTLTINGKTEPLKHAYARRVAAKEAGDEAAIEVLLTSQPISGDLLAKIFAEMDKDFFARDEGLKGVAPRALYVQIPKNQSYKNWGVSFTGSLLTPEGLIGSGKTNQFQEFDLQKGMMKAKAQNQWEDTDYDSNFQEKKYECSYSLSFEVPMGEAPARTTNPGIVPDAGTAKGMMKSKDGRAALKYAYAWRERLFFDEPDERIVVLVTNKPIPKGAEAGIINGETRLEKHGLQGLRFLINEFGKLHWGHVIDKFGGALSTNKFKNVAFAIENGRVNGKADFDKDADDEEDFSVAFEAPLKN